MTDSTMGHFRRNLEAGMRYVAGGTTLEHSSGDIFRITIENGPMLLTDFDSAVACLLAYTGRMYEKDAEAQSMVQVAERALHAIVASVIPDEREKAIAYIENAIQSIEQLRASTPNGYRYVPSLEQLLFIKIALKERRL